MTKSINYSNQLRFENFQKETEQKQAKYFNVFSLLNRFLQHLATDLVQGQEPRIRQTTDRVGKTWWHGCDPVTGRSVCRESEEEMRIWLEERYDQ